MSSNQVSFIPGICNSPRQFDVANQKTYLLLVPAANFPAVIVFTASTMRQEHAKRRRVYRRSGGHQSRPSGKERS